MTDYLQQQCDGSDDPRRRCGLHHPTGLAMMGGYSCCCGEYWTSKNECMTGAKSGDPVDLRDRVHAVLDHTVNDAWADIDKHTEGVMGIIGPELERLRRLLAEKEAEVDDKSRVGHAVADAWQERAALAEEECAAVRQQLTAAKIALKGAEREAEAVASGRESAQRSHKMQAGIAGSLAKELRAAEDALARIRQAIDALIADGFGATTPTLRGLRDILDGPAVSEEQTGGSNG